MFNFFKRPTVNTLDEGSVDSMIDGYKKYCELNPDYTEPNIILAEKVFNDFNAFSLKLADAKVSAKIVPKSLLPYPKNYIKAACYIFAEHFHDDDKTFNLINEVAATLFL